MEIAIEVLLLLFLVAAVAGWVDAISGGGGMLALPAMLLAGVPPAAALATNKLQGSAGTLMASFYFIRKGVIDIRQHKVLIVITFLGALSGSWLVLQFDAETLVALLPLLLIVIGLYFLFSARVGDVDRKARIPFALFVFMIAPILGFYDGFFGPGTGNFMTVLCVVLLGYNLTKATAQAKVLNATSNVAALIYFIGFGEIYWQVGIVMIFGQLIGALLGAKMALANGTKLIRPVVVIVCFVMSLNLLF